MRERVEALLDADCRAMWVSTFHALCARLLRREAPQHRPQPRLHHLRLGRPAVGDQAAAARSITSMTRRTSRAWCWAASAPPRTGWKGPRASPTPGTPATRRSASSIEGYIKALKDASALDFDDLLLKTVELFDQSAGRPRALRASLQLRDGGRVPGHQPAAVPADQAARRRAPQPGRRRRSRSVDLQVARRRPAQHHGLRDRLPRRADRPARAELPLDAR